MDIEKFLQEMGVIEFFQGISELFSMTEIILLMVLLILLLILFSTWAMRKRSAQLVDIDRKILYELNQLNANLPKMSKPDPERTDPMF